jgi:C4-dicarboxylate-specific signal transduction histidine kinase
MKKLKVWTLKTDEILTEMNMKKDSEKLPIRLLVGRSHLFVGSIVLFLCSFAYILNDVMSFRNSLNDQLKATAKILTYNLVPSLQFKDNQDAKKILLSLASNSDIASAVVLDPDKKIFASYGETDPVIDKVSSNTREDGEVINNKYYFEDYISQDGQNLGSLILVSKMTSLEAQYKHYFLIATLVTFFCLLLAYLISMKMKTILSQPIEDLLVLIKKVSYTGNYTTESIQNSGLESSILEIENLSNEFENMMNQICNRDQAIHQANLDLEQKVEERTNELMKTQLELNQSARLSSLGEMAGGIAHEINNPLAVIIGKINILKCKVEDKNLKEEELIVNLDKIEGMVTRISKIIRGLRSFSRDGSGDPFENVSLKSIFEDAGELYRSRNKNSDVELRLPDFHDISLECRATEIGQVVLNLMNNAFDAIQTLPEKWIEVDYKITLDRLTLTITDSGNGIPADIREKMMNPFFTTKGVGKGTGLGLSISVGIIQKHGGKFYVDAEHTRTKFVIEIPLKQSEIKKVA